MTKVLSNATQITLVARGYIDGLILSTAGSSATFSVAPGVAADNVNSIMMLLSSSISKTTSAWAVGSGNGSLDTGSIANNTWYHVYLIKRPDTGVVDVLTSLSASAPTMPANYTLKRRIGSLRTNGSAQWTLFSQNGDEFLWDASVLDVNAASLAASTPTLYTLSVPTGVKVNALFYGDAAVTANTIVLVNFISPDTSTTAAGTAASNLGVSIGASGQAERAFAGIQVRTNTSAQVRAVAFAAVTLYIGTYGWIDQRGKNS